MTFQKNGIRRSDEEIWKWHEHIEQYSNGYLKKPDYCKQNNLDPKQFQNMYYRLVFKRDSNPPEYQKYVKLARECLNSSEKLETFAKKHKLSESQLACTITHLSYLKVIERIKEAKLPKSDVPSGFIEVPQNIELKQLVSHQGHVIPVPPSPPTLPEVIEKKNDLEIIITKGVKVSISPNIEPMTVIKIIELLQEL